ncbi:MAG: DUF687 family protein [Verrucomicrobia bacterium]|nr:DUF687 family protein [Verrucomicrobiota bacterium]
MRRLLFSLSQFVSVLLFSNQDVSWHSLAVFEGEPSANVEGTVNTLTGDYFVSEEDLIVSGVEPLRIQRCYLSSKSGQHHSGWFHPILSHVHYKNAASKNMKDLKKLEKFTAACGTIRLIEASGSELIYDTYRWGLDLRGGRGRKNPFKDERDNMHRQGDFQLHPSLANYVITNSARGGVSGRTSLKNSRVSMPEDMKTVTLHLADGTTRTYRRRTKDEKTYHIEEEQLPTGNWIVYSYGNEGSISEIRTMNPSKTVCYAWARTSFKLVDQNHDTFQMETSDGKILHYRSYRPREDIEYFLYDHITHPELPDEQITYHAMYDFRGPLIHTRSFPNGRTLQANYYGHKHNYVLGQDIYIKELTDPKINRVQSLLAPVGPDEKLLPIHTFFYNPGEPGKRGGDTYVIDAAQNKTHYRFSPEFRLDAIEYYAGFEPHHTEKLTWGAPKTPQAGNLLSRTFLNSRQEVEFAKHYIYDDSGNVLTEHAIGNLTGAHVQETASKHFAYSTDGRNLLVRSQEENGTVILYGYHPRASLLTSKLTLDGGRIALREFFEYNDDLICIKEITDDGWTSDPKDLTGIKIRKIRNRILRTENPFIGMPCSVEERYLENGEERLLQKTLLTYSPTGKILRKDLYDAEGVFRYSLHYTYDAKGRLLTESNPIGQVATSAYDENGNLISYTDFSGVLTTLSTYDFSNRLIQQQILGLDGTARTSHRRYDFKHNLISEIDSFGNETRHTYDAFGHPIETHLPPMLNGDGNLSHPVLTATYDDAGRKISSTTARGETTHTTYNSRGKPLRIDHPDGGREEFLYYLDGTLSTAIDQEGKRTSYTYDYQGRELTKTETAPDGTLLTQESYTYSAFHLQTKTDAEGNVTTFYYDAAGRKSAQEFAGHRTEYQYDSLGRLCCVISCGDHPSFAFTEYDLLGRPIEERVEDRSGTILSQVAYTYDAIGNKSTVTRVIQGNPATEFFRYDSFSRPIEQVDALGNTTRIVYKENHFNALGQRVLQKIQTDPNGLQTLETYDAHGRLALVQKRSAFGAELHQEEFFYDLAGNLSRQVSTIYSPQHAPRTNTLCWEYGALNRLITLIEPEGKVTRTTYTLKGQPHQIYKPDGVILSHIYDPLGRLTEQTSSDGALHLTFTYDRLHRLLSSTDQLLQTSTTRIYDPHGNVLQETLANGNTLSHTYDNRGRCTLLTLPDDTTIRYEYDSLFLRTVKRQAYSHHYTTYDLSGHLIEEELIHHLGKVHHTLDPVGRSTQFLSPYFNQSHTAFDPSGNLLSMEWSCSKQEDTHHYQYDALYQLTEETGAISHQFTYDSHANRLSYDNAPYRVNALNQLLTTANSTYDYDPNGNLIATNQSRLRYDPLNRLISIETPDQLLTFTYDTFHRRQTKTLHTKQNGTWTQTQHLSFLYDGQNEIGATEDTAIIQLRILGSTPRAEIGAAIAIELRGRVYAPIHDMQGNLRCLVSEQGEIVESYLYSAFREEGAQNPSPLGNPWRFSSKRMDEETHLIYYGRRYYDPDIGRWITPDPQGFSDGPNLYAFVHNAPLLRVDLYGLETWADVALDLKRWNTKSTDFVRKSSAERPQALPRTAAPSWKDTALQMPIGGILGPKLGQKSRTFEVGERTVPNLGMGFINGIGTTFEESTAHARRLSGYANNLKMHCVYNATHGFASDILESGLGYCRVKTTPVRLLQKTWEKFFAESGPKGIFLQHCHSQGAIHVKNALLGVEESIRNRITVLAIAPAAIIPSEFCRESFNYKSSRDVVTYFDVAGMRRYRDQLITLTPHRDAPFFDHDYASSTYQSSILGHIKDHLDRGGR